MMHNWLIVTKGHAQGTLEEGALLSCGTLFNGHYWPLACCQRAQGPLKMPFRELSLAFRNSLLIETIKTDRPKGGADGKK